MFHRQNVEQYSVAQWPDLMHIIFDLTMLVLLLHFAPVIICLEPGLLSPHAGVGRFLQSSLQTI